MSKPVVTRTGTPEGRRRFGEELRRRRAELGMSQEEFGNRIGISRPAVSLLESGENGPSEPTLEALEAQFGLTRQTSNELLGRVPESGQRSELSILVEMSNLPDEDVRLQYWMSLPASVRNAVLKAAEDLSRDYMRRLQALREQTND